MRVVFLPIWSPNRQGDSQSDRGRFVPATSTEGAQSLHRCDELKLPWSTAPGVRRSADEMRGIRRRKAGLRAFKVTEGAGIARILKHMRGKQFGILSANRKVGTKLSDGTVVTKRYNTMARKALGHALRSMGYGYVKVSGRSSEKHHGRTVHVQEPSFFVPGIRRSHIRKLGKLFHQDSVIHGRKGRVHLVRSKRRAKPLATWRRVRLKRARYGTQKGGKHFTFRRGLRRARRGLHVGHVKT
jgi:hypothetical protein